MERDRGARARALALIAGVVCAAAAGRSLAERRPAPCEGGFSTRVLGGSVRAICGPSELGAAQPGLPLGARRALGLAADLNALTERDLEELSGIGPSLARRILAARRARGGLSSVEELASVPGVGPARMAALRAALTPAGL